jgi:hypothetical protein
MPLEAFDFLTGRRQTGEVEGDSAKQGAFVGLFGGRQFFLFEPGEDECVNGGLNPALLADLRWGRADDGLEGPKRASLLQGHTGGFDGEGFFRKGFRMRVGHAALHPFGDRVYLRRVEWVFGRQL